MRILGGVRSMQFPARDMPTHTKMKYRAGAQVVDEVDQATLKAKTDERELDASRTEAKKSGALLLADGTDVRQTHAIGPVLEAKPQLLLETEAFAPGELDKYDDRDDDDSDDDSDESDVDDDDEELALQLELEKIKKEREEERIRKEREAAMDEQAARDAASLNANPLLHEPSGAVKRKWNDDVVFRNQARAQPDNSKKQFINDTIRSDFHRRFLSKYVN